MDREGHPYRVLFLCTGNSARSVFAEYFLRRLGGARFEAYSAGANPSGVINPLTVKVLRERFHVDASGARSKSWDEFRDIKFDFVVTVCDSARESCPVLAGSTHHRALGSRRPSCLCRYRRGQGALLLQCRIDSLPPTAIIHFSASREARPAPGRKVGERNRNHRHPGRSQTKTWVTRTYARRKAAPANPFPDDLA